MLGSKIENLIKLKDNKFNVPKFVVIKFEDFVKKDFFKFKYDFDLSIFDNSKNLKALMNKNFKNIDLKLDNKKYAVRSSCNMEDGENFSFAGLFDTYLNVESKDIISNIKKCFLSLYNPNVIEYMLKNKLNIDNLRMNVIIQEMVDSKYSGIIFTSNPQGLINESVIVVGKGLGENVVGDKVDTTNYYYNLDDNNYYFEGNEDLISDRIPELIDISKQIKRIFGNFLDIEFAIADKIYILQTRRITTLNDSHVLIMDNSNIVESYPNISLPLTCSFVDMVYSGIFRNVSYRLLKDKNELNKLNDVFENMVGNCNGRIYYKISNWYYIIRCLPFSNKIIPIWQEMLGVSNKKVIISKSNISWVKKIKVSFNFFKSLINNNKNMDMLNKKFIKINDRFYKNFNNLTLEQVKNVFEEIQEELLKIWDITLINDMYAFIFTGLFKKINKKHKDLSNEYISGISNIESLKPVKELINLSLECENLSSDEQEKKKKEYIKLYGDRGIEELKLETETFRTNPKLLDKQINEYIHNAQKLKSLSSNKKELPKLNFVLQIILNKCRIGIKNREISRLNRSRIFGMVREMMIYFGKSFAEEKLIDNQNDIFYLTIDEVFNLVETKENMVNVIEERKKQYDIYRLLPSYSRLVFMNHEFNKTHLSVNLNKIEFAKNNLLGIPCSGGIVEGEAYVINNIDDIDNNSIKDKILITKMTDPGWVFLISLAKGIISEKGSILSHTAIISRELNIPSIVGVANLLDNVKTGDIIKMNGNNGKIEIKR